MIKKLILFFFFLYVPFISAIELSLEENKFESGTIGYVDIEKVFKRYPLTKKAKDKFKEKIKENITYINNKEEELSKIKTKIIKLKQEKELALFLQSFTEVKISSGIEQIDASTITIKNSNIENIITNNSTFTIKNSNIENIVVENSTFNIKTSSYIVDINISTENIVNEELKLSTNNIVETITNQTIENKVVVDTNSTGEVVPSLMMPGIGKLSFNHFKFSVSTSPVEIENEIVKQENDYKNTEKIIDDYKKDIDKEMLNYEDMETEKILGRIYLKLKELSLKEGVSVVVDKKSILFGHKAVDLTNKLIKTLEEDDYEN